MRKQFADAVYVHDRFFVTIVYGSLYFVQTNFFTHLAGELIVDGMPRTSSYDTAFNRFADKSKITNNIQKFVTGTFISPHQRFVIDIS